ncbi:MAG: Calx-beta domain-containing protein [Chloroflexota bacterium]
MQVQTANGTATAGSDYTAVSQTVTFNPGETSKPFVVAILGDTIDEPNETFTVTLSGRSTRCWGIPRGTGRSWTTTGRRRCRSTT